MDDQKKCKHCAMMVPKEASICPHCRKRIKTSLFTKIIAGFFILVFIGYCQGVSNKSSTPSIPIGQKGILAGTSGTHSPVAVTNDALDQFQKHKTVNDQHGITQQIVSGSLFSVKNGTKVLVIEHGSMFVRKIRVLEGEMKGRAGFVPEEWIKPI